MKLVDFETLKKLPSGTIFAEYADFYVNSPLAIKVNEGKDFYRQYSDTTYSPVWLHGFIYLCLFGESIKNLFEIGDKQALSFKMCEEEHYSKDKFQKYLILDEDDIDRVIDIFTWAKNGCVGENPGEVRKQYDTTDIVYFKLSMPGYKYPDNERFKYWMIKYGKYDYDCGNQIFQDENWVKENQLCVRCVSSPYEHPKKVYDSFCVTATREWVQDTCPELLTDYTEFLRYPTYSDGRYISNEENIYMYDIERGGIFLPYKEENIGIEWD